MGGDDSQKLLPWRESTPLRGANLRHNYEIKNTSCGTFRNERRSTRLRPGLSLQEIGDVTFG
jgi:hypothetical protein